MLKRIITSVVALAVFIPILIFSDTWVFPAAMSICAAIGVFEMLVCLGFKKNFFLTVPLCLAAAFLPTFMRYSYLLSLRSFAFASGFFDGVGGFLKLAVGIMFLMSLYIFAVAVFGNKTVKITDAGLLIAASIYIIGAFCSIVYIHDYIQMGNYVYLLTFICAWSTDIFAYFTGRFLGKHKLIPAVSPKKTVEGAIGGIVFCVIAMVVFGLIIDKFFNSFGIIRANYGVLAVSGIFISIVSQIGDLVMSVIKRHYNIKDYGWLFPGHGGILDRFDSVLAVSLILGFICTYFNLFAMM